MGSHQVTKEAGAPDGSPIVAIRSLAKNFGEKVVLQGLTWDVPSGQICGLLGPNGAGKTTLFRLLMGILKATGGRIEIDGRDAFEDRIALKRVIGFLPDEPVYYSYLTGMEILELSAGMHGLDVGAATGSLAPLIDRLKLDDSIDRFAEEYSRGMKKKLGLLLALLHQPRLLILDEPTNGLDVESTRLFFDLMQELASQGTTVLFSTHLMNHVERICSHVAIVHHGRLVVSGDLDEIRSGFGHQSLEDAFVRIVGAPPTDDGGSR